MVRLPKIASPRISCNDTRHIVSRPVIHHYYLICRPGLRSKGVERVAKEPGLIEAGHGNSDASWETPRSGNDVRVRAHAGAI